LSEEDEKRAADPTSYVYYGPLGSAFLRDRRCVVLIDEIDKADIDFPNDLLLELDEQRFIIEELRGIESIPKEKKVIRARHAPIVFITSNDEKDLPDAFLRRCLFHYIEFPKPTEMYNIIRAHFPDPPEKLLVLTLKRFLELRLRMEKGHSTKKVTTSELVDWLRVLSHAYGQDEILTELAHQLIYPGVLLKSMEDYRDYVPLLHKEDEQAQETLEKLERQSLEEALDEMESESE
jgi:MoxR-like ATPase